MLKKISPLFKIFLLCLFVLLSINLKAQSRLGIKGGLNFSNIGGTSTYDFSSRIAPVFGIFIEIPLTGNLYLQPEFLYSFQGAHVSEKSANTSTSMQKNLISLQYLQIPFLAKLYLGEIVHLQFGPQYSLLLNSTESGTHAGRAFKTPLQVNINSVDWSIIAGLGVDVHPNINIGLRYNYGISNMNPYSSGTLQNAKIYNRVINLHIGYMF